MAARQFNKKVAKALAELSSLETLVAELEALQIDPIIDLYNEIVLQCCDNSFEHYLSIYVNHYWYIMFECTLLISGVLYEQNEDRYKDFIDEERVGSFKECGGLASERNNKLSLLSVDGIRCSVLSESANHAAHITSLDELEKRLSTCKNECRLALNAVVYDTFKFRKLKVQTSFCDYKENFLSNKDEPDPYFTYKVMKPRVSKQRISRQDVFDIPEIKAMNNNFPDCVKQLSFPCADQDNHDNYVQIHRHRVEQEKQVVMEREAKEMEELMAAKAIEDEAAKQAAITKASEVATAKLAAKQAAATKASEEAAVKNARRKTKTTSSSSSSSSSNSSAAPSQELASLLAEPRDINWPEEGALPRLSSKSNSASSSNEPPRNTNKDAEFTGAPLPGSLLNSVDVADVQRDDRNFIAPEDDESINNPAVSTSDTGKKRQIRFAEGRDRTTDGDYNPDDDASESDDDKEVKKPRKTRSACISSDVLLSSIYYLGKGNGAPPVVINALTDRAEKLTELSRSFSRKVVEHCVTLVVEETRFELDFVNYFMNCRFILDPKTGSQHLNCDFVKALNEISKACVEHIKLSADTVLRIMNAADTLAVEDPAQARDLKEAKSLNLEARKAFVRAMKTKVVNICKAIGSKLRRNWHLLNNMDVEDLPSSNPKLVEFRTRYMMAACGTKAAVSTKTGDCVMLSTKLKDAENPLPENLYMLMEFMQKADSIALQVGVACVVEVYDGVSKDVIKTPSSLEEQKAKKAEQLAKKAASKDKGKSASPVLLDTSPRIVDVSPVGQSTSAGISTVTSVTTPTASATAGPAIALPDALATTGILHAAQEGRALKIVDSKELFLSSEISAKLHTIVSSVFVDIPVYNDIMALVMRISKFNMNKLPTMKVLLFLLKESCTSHPMEQTTDRFMSREFNRAIECYFLISYNANDYYNTGTNGYCLHRVCEQARVRAESNYAMSMSESKAQDERLFSDHSEAAGRERLKFYEMLEYLQQKLMVVGDVNAKERIANAIYSFKTYNLRGLAYHCWGKIDWIKLMPFNVTAFDNSRAKDFVFLPNSHGKRWALVWTSTLIRDEECFEKYDLQGNVTTLEEVAAITSQPANYAVFQVNHFFMVPSPSRVDSGQSFMNLQYKIMTILMNRVRRLPEVTKLIDIIERRVQDVQDVDAPVVDHTAYLDECISAMKETGNDSVAPFRERQSTASSLKANTYNGMDEISFNTQVLAPLNSEQKDLKIKELQLKTDALILQTKTLEEKYMKLVGYVQNMSFDDRNTDISMISASSSPGIESSSVDMDHSDVIDQDEFDNSATDMDVSMDSIEGVLQHQQESLETLQQQQESPETLQQQN